jgi:DNA-(apurinic or apyrimidinic site) lyase
LEIFFKNEEKYYENMSLLQEELAKIMNQKKEDKTIVFAVKMFSY